MLLVKPDLESIRSVIGRHGRLLVPAGSLDGDTNLYNAGLTSLATVGVMLALEEQFGIEFPDNMLQRRTFESLNSISRAISQLEG